MYIVTRKLLLTLSGLISLGLGIVGAFLPVLPTVPLILLAAFCFARSSDRLHAWLTGHRYFGEIIRNFEAGNGIPRRVKTRAIVTLWISMSVSCLIVAKPLLCLMLVCIGAATSTYIWSMPETKEFGAPEL